MVWKVLPCKESLSSKVVSERSRAKACPRFEIMRHMENSSPRSPCVHSYENLTEYSILRTSTPYVSSFLMKVKPAEFNDLWVSKRFTKSVQKRGIGAKLPIWCDSSRHSSLLFKANLSNLSTTSIDKRGRKRATPFLRRAKPADTLAAEEEDSTWSRFRLENIRFA